MKRRLRRVHAFAVTVLAALPAAAWQIPGRGASQPPKELPKNMNPAPAHLELTAAPSGGRNHLLPEQAASFDLVFRNLSSREERFLSMTGNAGTPDFRLYDDAGRLLGQFAPTAGGAMGSGHIKFEESPPAFVYLMPGVQDGASVNLWNYTASLPPGRYRLQVSHHAQEGGAVVPANPVGFDIVPALVTHAAMNYSTSAHAGSLLSWIAQAADRKSAPELLIRLSANGRHDAVLSGAWPAGSVESGADLASGALPPFSQAGHEGWLAIASGGKVEMLHHVFAQVDWRSGPIPLPLANIRMVPGFPDRQHALFLATGHSRPGSPVLLGLPLTADPARNAKPRIARQNLQPGPSSPIGIDLNAPLTPGGAAGKPFSLPAPAPAPKRDLPAYHPWTVPLKGDPIRAAVAFDAEGPVSVLLVYDDHGRPQLSRIDMDEAGKMTAPERQLLTGQESTGILAIAVDQRKDHPISFVVLAGDRRQHNRLALIRLPLQGAPVSKDFPALAGWPMKTENGHSVPLAVAEAAMDIAQDGTPWLAMVDETGHFYGGPLNGSPLALLRDHGKCSHPFVAALSERVTPGCFTETGQLFPEGATGHAH
jgi:hypothetical protein